MAGVDIGTAYLTVAPSAKGFVGSLQSQLGAPMATAGGKAGDTASKGFGTRFKAGVGTAAKAGALALAGTLALGIGFAKGAIAEARESQKVGAVTSQIIKSTGGAAKITADQVGDLATAISNKAGIDDEAIQSGANLLLTFKNVKNEVGTGANIFDRATQAAVDLSAAGFGSVEGGAKMLGKALNDPIKGISALGRAGVTFTAGQKDQIKALVASGKTLDAQKIILKEVESQVGGTAAASATAGEKMSVAFGNFKENIGTSLLPTLDKLEQFFTTKLLPGVQGVIDVLFKGDFTSGFAQAFNISEDSGIVDFLFDVREGAQRLGDYVQSKVIPSLQGFFTEMQVGTGKGGAFVSILKATGVTLLSVAGFIQRNSDVIVPLIAAVGAGVVVFKAITTAAKVYAAVQAGLNVVLAANPIGIVIVVLAALAVGLVAAYKKSETFRNIVNGAFTAISAAAKFMWNNVVAPIIRFLIDGFVSVTRFYATLLRGLSKVPGFGWAKGAADKLQDVANKAAGIRDNIKSIPDSKRVTVSVGFVQTGRITLPGGAKVNVGMRAAGGPVKAGNPYIVGEKRPELFVPDRNGTILPSVPNGGVGGGRIVNFNGPVGADPNEVVRKLDQRDRMDAALNPVFGG